MSKYKILGTGKQVELNSSHFVAKGGEGSVYIKGRTVYKICEPGCMIPHGKFQELSVLNNDSIIKPQDIILDHRNNQCGYTMKKVPGKAVSLAQILTKTAREQENVSEKTIQSLVKQMRDGIQYIHEKGCLQVDGNELNYMVTNKYQDLYFIDVNSFQTKSYKATAIMQSIRDFSAKEWTKNSDWFSFAVIAFYMFTGIHPYKGKHKKVKSLEDRMRQNISVMDSSVIIPKNAVYFPFENFIPKSYMDWFKAVLVDGKRLEPPKDFQDIVNVIPVVKNIVGSNLFNIEKLQELDENIIGRFTNLGSEVFVTKKNLVFKNSKVEYDHQKVAFSPVKNIPYAFKLVDNSVHVQNLKDKTSEILTLSVDKLMSYGGRVYGKSGRNVYEFNISELPNKNNFSFVPVAVVSEMASRVFSGVIIQNLFDNCFVSVFPESKRHRTIKVQELNNYKIIDAKYLDGVLMVIGNKNGKYDRFVFRFDKDWKYDTRIIEDITPVGINFTVLDNGLCVSMDESETIEIFSRVLGHADIKTLSDDVLGADMRLFSSGSQVMFARGSDIFSLSVK